MLIDICRVCRQKIGEQPSKTNIHRAKCNARMKCAVCGATFRAVGNKKIKKHFVLMSFCVQGRVYSNAQSALCRVQTIKQYIGIAKIVKCMACNIDKFLYPQQLYDHIAQEHPKIRCTTCKQVFMLQSQLDEYMASAHD